MDWTDNYQQLEHEKTEVRRSGRRRLFDSTDTNTSTRAKRSVSFDHAIR